MTTIPEEIIYKTHVLALKFARKECTKAKKLGHNKSLKVWTERAKNWKEKINEISQEMTRGQILNCLYEIKLEERRGH